MPTSPFEWYPPCYTIETLLPALQAALKVTPALTGVARWLPEGCSNSDIGVRLGKSAHTVRTQTQQLSRDLGTRTREALVARIVARIWAHSGDTGAWRPPGDHLR